MLTKHDIETLKEMKELVKVKGTISSVDMKLFKIKKIAKCNIEIAIKIRNTLKLAIKNFGYEIVEKLILNDNYREGFGRALEICNKGVK